MCVPLVTEPLMKRGGKQLGQLLTSSRLALPIFQLLCLDSVNTKKVVRMSLITTTFNTVTGRKRFHSHNLSTVLTDSLSRALFVPQLNQHT